MWKNLSPCLKAIYETYGMSGSLSKDEKDLKKAFIHTEQLWESQFQQMGKIRFVLLGEAPLYGQNESYFYNENSEYTAFFRHEIHPIVKLTHIKKADLFKHLRENGFIILDIFPFAFNDDTAFKFKKISRKRLQNLFCAISEYYFKPKLEKIRTKSNKKTAFSLRYKKHKVLLDILRVHLKTMGFLANGTDIGCIGSKNMPLDIEKLEIEYRKAIDDL
jgi:hypothetical protein